MKSENIYEILKTISPPANFTAINFGCRVNAAETNQICQLFLNFGFVSSSKNPKIILINTCAITKKGESESIRKVKSLSQKFPKSSIFVTGCVSSKKITSFPNVYFFNNFSKQKILKKTCSYTPKIKDKFSKTKKIWQGGTSRNKKGRYASRRRGFNKHRKINTI